MTDQRMSNLRKTKPANMSREEYRARRNARVKYIRLKKRRRNIRIACAIILTYMALNIPNYNTDKAVNNLNILDINNDTKSSVKNTKSIYGLSENLNPIDKPEITIDHLPINPISRPGNLIKSVDHIVLHYVGNAGTTASQNRSYYEEIIATMEASVSSNYLVGLEGEIIECVPSHEVAYASNHMNSYSISIEVSHPDDSGEFNEDTYKSMVKLTAWLCGKYELTSEDLLRHYDVTGKECPKSFVDKPALWEQFKKDVKNLINMQ